VERRERERIMRQGVVLPETPRDRRNLQGLVEDMRDNPLAGKQLALRLRHFRPDASNYLASLGGPPPYMARLREIAALTAVHEDVLAEEYRLRGSDPAAWQEIAERWDFGEVNDLIDRHNRWYPAERRLPMDPMTGDYALVNGEHYSKRPLDATWVLERFPPVSSAARSQRV
jgi:hypothetical protein